MKSPLLCLALNFTNDGTFRNLTSTVIERQQICVHLQWPPALGFGRSSCRCPANDKCNRFDGGLDGRRHPASCPTATQVNRSRH